MVLAVPTFVPLPELTVMVDEMRSGSAVGSTLLSASALGRWLTVDLYLPLQDA